MSTTARRAALAAVRKNLPAYTKPRWPKPGEKPHNTVELLSGAEFEGGNVLQDLATYLAPMLQPAWPHKLPKRLMQVMKGLCAEPSLARMRMVEDAAQTVLDDTDAGRAPILAQTVSIVEDIVERMLVYAAAFGCQRAAMRCAVLCCRHWRGRPTGFADPVTHGFMLSMLEYLHVADLHLPPVDVRGYIQESRHLQIWQADKDARRLVYLLSLVHEAIDTPEPGASAPDDPEDRAAVAEDRAGIVRQAPPVTRTEPDFGVMWFNEDGSTHGEGDPPLAPGMVVIGDVSHVKKGGKGDHDPVKDAEAIIGKRLTLVTPPADLGAARSELLGDAPHGERVIDRLLRPLAAQDSVRIPPVLIWGPPGAGKTRFARRYGEVLDLSPALYSLGGSSDAMALTGVARGWSTGGFCAPLREILRTKIANPLLVVDEIDKVGTSRHNGHAGDALISMIGETAARYRDPYLQAEVDLSRVQWILTANSLDNVPRPLLDRCLVLRLDEPGPAHLRQLATSILADVRADRGLDEQWAPAFDGVEWAALEAYWPGGSLRALRRLVETVLDAREAGPRQ
ncbi:putative AAA ATPase domain protein [Methylorubrum extorquens DM4]|uniref:AAA ATPase domain protein n=1 Tax=Methylorubrum extorquens (strain DSM 6343 / CIP 106787 / DM4) TaxID=661410 RepID=C7C7W9_METED|nr:AAA family ATPase [Methylorubrum extorquens]CAX21898.1 putative AAA ATPase domain protein [Methylorubrum extorquens DM4]